MKKKILIVSLACIPIALAVLVFEKVSNPLTFTAEDRVHIDPNMAQRISVYGDIHAVSNSDGSLYFDEEIQETQVWLCKKVTEPIVIAESIPGCDSVTFTYIVNQLRRDSPNMSQKEVLERLSIVGDNYVSYLPRFVLHSDKLIFGGENDSLYCAIGKQGDAKNTPENVNARSRAMLLNAIKIAEKYPTQRIAIIIGRKHLPWFAWNGIKTIDPNKVNR